MSSGGIATAPPMLFPAGEGAAELPMGHPTAPGPAPGGSTAQPTRHRQGTGRKPAPGEMKHKPLQGAIGAQMAEQPLLLTQRSRGGWRMASAPRQGSRARPLRGWFRKGGQQDTLGRRVGASDHPNQI